MPATNDAGGNTPGDEIRLHGGDLKFLRGNLQALLTRVGVCLAQLQAEMPIRELWQQRRLYREVAELGRMLEVRVHGLALRNLGKTEEEPDIFVRCVLALEGAGIDPWKLQAKASAEDIARAEAAVKGLLRKTKRRS